MKFSGKFIKAGLGMCDFNNHVPAPYLRKSFNLQFKPENAEITICGLGFYRLYINGNDITKGPLAPYISNTDDLCYYDNYDISALLTEGENVIGIMLGNGFRNPFGGFIWDFHTSPHRGDVTAAVYLEATDGVTNFELEADETFKVHASPIIFDELRMGCYYDARMEIPDWNKPGFDDSEWQNAKWEKTPKGEKKLCTAEPIVITEELKPVQIKHYESLPFSYVTVNPEEARENTVRKNVYVYDFGVNSAGVTKLKINGKAGQKITIRHGEQLVNGKFSMKNIMFNRDYSIDLYEEYAQKDVFICKGGHEEFVPEFKYDGFRYAYVEGLEEEQATEDALTMLIMNSNIKKRASFECSDPVVNKLQEATVRADLANFYYFPTDCPHREKNGWTGDASMSAEQMLINLTVEKSLKEWLCNIRKAQNSDGALPGIVPTGGWGFEWGNGPAWDSVSVNLPYYIYKYTGDKKVITQNASMILRYLCYICTKRNVKGLVEIGLGDWVDPFQAEKGYISSPLIFTDSAMVFDIARKAAFLFKEAGMLNESNYAISIAENFRNAIRDELIDFNTCTVAGDCQTSQAFAIEAGLFNERELPRARRRLVEIVHRDGDINACGMIGLRYIFHALTDAGESELAYNMITSKTRTGYGYWIENGATTLWESFRTVQNINSMNHHFLGDISSWFIQELAGLKPNPHCNDISYFEISPEFVCQLDWAKASYKNLKTEWKRNGGEIELTVFAPEETSGKIIMKNGYKFSDGTFIKDWKADKNLEIKLTVTQERD